MRSLLTQDALGQLDKCNGFDKKSKLVLPQNIYAIINCYTFRFQQGYMEVIQRAGGRQVGGLRQRMLTHGCSF